MLLPKERLLPVLRCGAIIVHFTPFFTDYKQRGVGSVGYSIGGLTQASATLSGCSEAPLVVSSDSTSGGSVVQSAPTATAHANCSGDLCLEYCLAAAHITSEFGIGCIGLV